MAGVELIELRSDEATVTVAPRLGGRVHSFLDRAASREWLWRNTSVPLGPVSPDALYDDVWQGGLEELFPSDAREAVDGMAFPDHGELWNRPWEVVDLAPGRHVALATVGPVTQTHVEKRFELVGPCLRLRYSLHNPSPRTLPFLFKLHAAIAVVEGCRLELPGGVAEPVDVVGFSRLLASPEPVAWPGPTDVDISRCRDRSSGLREFVYVHELPEGRCGVLDERIGRRLTLTYDRQAFPYCWLFMTYGGWRDHEVVVLEPCTNHPKSLREALANGTCAVLPAGSTARYEATLSLEDA